MSKIKRALDVVNDLRSLADSIECLVDVIEGKQLESAPAQTPAPVEVSVKAKETSKEEKSAVTKEKESKKETKEKQPTLEEVRSVLAALSQQGKQAEVKAFITSFGVKKLSDIPQEKYQDLLKKVRVI